MGDMREYFDAMKEHRREVKERQRGHMHWAIQLLEESRFDYVKHTDEHYTVEGIADFWPGTGTYMFRGAKWRGRGVKNLLRELERRIPNEEPKSE